MKNLKIVFVIGLLLFVGVSCRQDKLGPLVNDGTAPKPITNPQVENLAGAAKITYTLPDDANLLYVKAEYMIKGVKNEAKSSLYKNNILVEGFGDTDERDVTLYAVSRSEVASTPVTVKIKPLPPPIAAVRNSFVVIETFGGINVKYDNTTAANIVIGVLIKDSLNEWQHVDFNYTSQLSGNFSIRGFASVARDWGVYVKDRWNNLSDTLRITLTPIYEEKIDKSKFADVRSSNFPVPQNPPLPISGGSIKNAVDYSGSYPLINLWDDNITKMFHTKQNVDQPVWVPMDLDKTGVRKFKFSRFKIWQRTSQYTFNHGNPHKWEIWGTNTPTVASSWIKLGEWTMEKPSGLPVGVNSNEDVQVATDGQEYEFPIGIPAVRYIAWKNIDCWGALDGATGFLHLMELTLWGQKQ